MYWMIVNINDSNLLWSNMFGWITEEGFTIFSDKEKQTLNLPMDGKWERFN